MRKLAPDTWNKDRWSFVGRTGKLRVGRHDRQCGNHGTLTESAVEFGFASRWGLTGWPCNQIQVCTQ